LRGVLEFFMFQQPQYQFFPRIFLLAPQPPRDRRGSTSLLLIWIIREAMYDELRQCPRPGASGFSTYQLDCVGNLGDVNVKYQYPACGQGPAARSSGPAMTTGRRSLENGNSLVCVFSDCAGSAIKNQNR